MDDHYGGYEDFGLPVIYRHSPVRAFGHWWLSLLELYLREPRADRFAIFQDDIVVSRNLRQYLEACPYPDYGYLNLCTYPTNMGEATGWYKSKQNGKGAQGLVFNNQCVQLMLCSPHFVKRIQNTHYGHQSIDGAVQHTLINAGWVEYVHNPSPICHVGVKSTIGHQPQPQTWNFRGEDYDMMSGVAP